MRDNNQRLYQIKFTAKRWKLIKIFINYRPYLKENFNIVYCIVFCILMDYKHNSMHFNEL